MRSSMPSSAHASQTSEDKHALDLSVSTLSLASPKSPPLTRLPSLESVISPVKWPHHADADVDAAAPLLSLCDASISLAGLYACGLLLRDDAPPLSPMSRIAQNKALAKRPAKISATTTARRAATSKTCRRHLSMQDLLCSEVARPAKTARSSKASHRRQCGILDCAKYALSGGFCIAHGGGKKCRQEHCETVAQSGGLCKAHGGGSKCKTPGCASVARRQGFCMTHGGRQPCKVAGCGKCAHGGGFCIAHGGGKRCASLHCAKSAQAGGFCYSHGGGKRCTAPECFQAARKGGRCIRHREPDADDHGDDVRVV